MSTGCSQWSILSLEIGDSWCAASFSFRPIIFFSFTLMTFLHVKLFADDTSLFSVVNNASVSACRVSNDLVKIRDWVFN